MPITDAVQQQLLQAMKARDAARTSALRMIKAALLEESKKGTGVVSDDDAVAVLRRLAKQREEAAEAYAQAGRADKADDERAEIAVIDAFLPQLADEATTLAWVQAAIAQTGASSPRELGRVMGALMKAHRGELEPGLARTLLERELAG
ncbi:MAG: GatB/YqeY domain-containing protein [Pseudomonadota bacterium]